MYLFNFFFFSSRRRHTRFSRDWSSDVCSSDLRGRTLTGRKLPPGRGGTLLPSGGIGRRRRLSSSCLKGVQIGPFPPTALTILALRSLTSQSRLSGSMRALLLWPRLSI